MYKLNLANKTIILIIKWLCGQNNFVITKESYEQEEIKLEISNDNDEYVNFNIFRFICERPKIEKSAETADSRTNS